ncbi:MAG TPA: two-component regulator propeller domain-containing protein, partial [Gaiellaceae bacterium]
YAGGAPGLFQLQPAHGAVYWYGGGSADDEDPEWNDLAAAGFPADADVHLPAVTCVRRTRDGTLWIGTAAGLARYLARSERGPLAYRTQLEAFPDLVPDAVSAIVEDERGLVWFGTDRGVFRFDGRDLFQYRESVDTWDQLGRADTLYDGSAKPPARGIWRYVRADNAWERFAAEAPLPDWAVFAGEVRSAEETAVTTIAFTDGVAAELLDAWDPSDFSAGTSTPVDPSQLELRCKPPGYEQIVAGGIPALPRLPPGESSWRYLSLEPSDLVPPASLPAWTIEGRLLRETTPPPDAEPDPGRWDETAPDADAGEFDEAVFAFAPAARVGFEWRPRRARAVLARLATRSPADVVEPAVLDRVWQGLQQVRPAGVHAALAVDETIVRKET